MKINPDQIFSSKTAIADGLSAILLFGPDQGLISETTAKCITAIAGKPVNPFMISELTLEQLKAEPFLLCDELRAFPMAGKRKIIIFRQVTDSFASYFEAALADLPMPNFLLVEAGDLPARSKLRKAFGTSKFAGAVGCYGDNHNNLKEVISEVLNARQVQINSDAMLELRERLGNDRMVSRSEIEKLALYAGESGQIEIEDITNVIGDSSAISLERVVFFAADGNIKLADQALIRALADGISPVQVLRGLQAHLQRLHIVSGELKCGRSINAALEQLKPPVFFKVKSRFQKQCQLWSLCQLVRAMNLVLYAEQQCKQTGAPMAAICQRAVLRLAVAAKNQSRRHS